MLFSNSTADIMHTNGPGPRLNIPRTSDRSTPAGTAAPTAQGAAGTPENAGASKAAQNTPQRSARPNNLMRTSIMNTLRKDPYHAEWQAWAETRDQEAGENRPEAVKRMKACLSKPNRKDKQLFLRLEGLGLNKQLSLHLEGLGLTSLPETLPAGITCLFASNNRLTSLPRNLPASLRYVQLDNNQFVTPPALPDHVSMLSSQALQDAQALREAEEAEDPEYEKFVQWLLSPSSVASKGASNPSPPEETQQQPIPVSDYAIEDLEQQITELEDLLSTQSKMLSFTSEGASTPVSDPAIQDLTQQPPFQNAQAAREAEEAELERLVHELSTSLVQEVSTHPLFASEGASNTSSPVVPRQQPTAVSDPTIQDLGQQIAELEDLLSPLSTMLSFTSEGASNTSSPALTRQQPTAVNDPAIQDLTALQEADDERVLQLLLTPVLKLEQAPLPAQGRAQPGEANP